MTPDRTDETPDDGAEHGVLDDSGSLDTSSIHILGGHIAQVSVDLPVSDDDDVDDDVVEDEMPIIDPESRGFEVVGIVQLPDADGPPPLTHVPDPAVAEATEEPESEATRAGDIILEPHDDADGWDADGGEVHVAELVHEDGEEQPGGPDADAMTGDPETEDAEHVDAALEDADVEPDAEVAHDAEGTVEQDRVSADAHGLESDHDSEPSAGGDVVETAPAPDDAEPADATVEDAEAAPAIVEDTAEEEPESVADLDVPTFEEHEAEPAAGEAEAAVEEPAPAEVHETAAETAVTREPNVAAAELPDADAAEPPPATAADVPADAAPATGPVPRTRAERAATGVIGTVPLTRREVHQADETARVGRRHATERVRTPATDLTLASKRLGEIDDVRESPDLLTADRLLDPRQIARPEPEGLWQQLVYSVSRHRINLGDGRRARARKDLDRRIAAPLSGEARFVPVVSRKGGVGKTTVTSLLGMALADARDDRVIAVDANPDRGTLADRVGRPNGRTVRDLVRAHDDVDGFGDVSSIVARDTTRLDVLASDSDPRVSEAFSDDDYRRVADIAAHYYSIVLTDTGTGIVHSVMEATLELADSLVVVAGLSVDEARLASETLTWLETNGYADRVRGAVVVLNNARPGAPLVRESELEAHFRSRVRAVIRMPYDAHVAAGSAIAFRDLQPGTRLAARELAAAVVEGLRTPAAVA
ncbi:MinD/ParA family protein [Microbacterium sp. 1P10AE]|uniref:MinD/ParA family ATP-binding protein n=1 Tax=Microbacterium sp. 1P10AE TaxID=3132286 RepID=UPI0039A1809C